ncbi:unnamed protein product [Vitrella brassicaformis CCMP3155]|uniref:Uncharacterized protein n=3 Tax=Vitrella brassicaformis TaxID=1169539 RepID=A0A0G4GS56_VITBC|nr:unnamed protein product [Vitrella brassicaformis CCMP3155]|eukprot:CEM33433.1 unnamed protein product [Vitrella brassicaformis CCMP3155]
MRTTANPNYVAHASSSMLDGSCFSGEVLDHFARREEELLLRNQELDRKKEQTVLDAERLLESVGTAAAAPHPSLTLRHDSTDPSPPPSQHHIHTHIHTHAPEPPVADPSAPGLESQLPSDLGIDVDIDGPSPFLEGQSKTNTVVQRGSRPAARGDDTSAGGGGGGLSSASTRALTHQGYSRAMSGREEDEGGSSGRGAVGGVGRSGSSVIASAGAMSVGAKVGSITTTSVAASGQGGGGSVRGKEERVIDDVFINTHVPMGGDVTTLHATIRLQKARILSLQEELQRRTQELGTHRHELVSCQEEAKGLRDDVKKLQRQTQHLETNLEKNIKKNDDFSQRLSSTESMLADVRREKEQLRTQLRKADVEVGGKEKRLGRLQEELDKYRSQLRDKRTDDRERASADRQTVDRLMAEVKKLERQRGELVSVFKKQAKLIDNLKRQKIHMEAARVLGFTEEEFYRLLDLDEQLPRAAPAPAPAPAAAASSSSASGRASGPVAAPRVARKRPPGAADGGGERGEGQETTE